MSMSRKLQYSQLVEAGALGRFRYQNRNLDRENARVVFQEQKELIHRLQCISFSEEM